MPYSYSLITLDHSIMVAHVFFYWIITKYWINQGGCCNEFSIKINDRDYVYQKKGQWKGKDYFYSQSDKKYLFFYHNYWGFSEVLGQPTFYYYAKADTQCPDNVSFLYYSWKVAGSATARLKCISKEETPVSSPGDSMMSSSLDDDKSAAATTKAPTTTTTPHTKCERTDLNPVQGGEWKCAGSVCRETVVNIFIHCKNMSLARLCII